jgi:hypothetical protein
MVVSRPHLEPCQGVRISYACIGLDIDARQDLFYGNFDPIVMSDSSSLRMAHLNSLLTFSRYLSGGCRPRPLQRWPVRVLGLIRHGLSCSMVRSPWRPDTAEGFSYREVERDTRKRTCWIFKRSSSVNSWPSHVTTNKQTASSWSVSRLRPTHIASSTTPLKNLVRTL